MCVCVCVGGEGITIVSGPWGGGGCRSNPRGYGPGMSNVVMTAKLLTQYLLIE